MSAVLVVRYPSAMEEYELTPQGAEMLASGDLSHLLDEEKLIVRFFWSREMLELPPPSAEECQNLLDLYVRASTDMMLFEMLFRGDLLVNSVEGEPDNFVWKGTAQGAETVRRYLDE